MRWSLFIDSHSGDMVLATHNNEDGEPMFSIRANDFRDVDGFRVPFRVQYMDGNKKVIATEEFEDIGIVAEKVKL